MAELNERQAASSQVGATRCRWCLVDGGNFPSLTQSVCRFANSNWLYPRLVSRPASCTAWCLDRDLRLMR